MPADVDPAAIRDRMTAHPLGPAVSRWLLELDPGQVAAVRARVDGQRVARWEVTTDPHRLAPPDLLDLARIVVDLEAGQRLDLDPLDGSGGALPGRLSRLVRDGGGGGLARRVGGGVAVGGVDLGDGTPAALVQVLVGQVVDQARGEASTMRAVVGELSAALVRAQAGGGQVAALQASWAQVADLRSELATVTAERDALRRAAAAALADADGDGPPSWIGELGQALGPVLELAGPLVAAWAAGRGAPAAAPDAASTLT
jgi:hypothetical protein